MSRWKISIGLFGVSIENLKTLKYHTFSKNISSFICSKYENENEKIFQEEESIGIKKIVGSIENI